MPVRIFQDVAYADLENKINAWLAGLGGEHQVNHLSTCVIKEDGRPPRLAVTIHYTSVLEPN
jgi:hypothetical protein